MLKVTTAMNPEAVIHKHEDKNKCNSDDSCKNSIMQCTCTELGTYRS